MKTFIEFVNEQPEDREINHDTWQTCAVGDYMREVQGINVTPATSMNVIAEDLLGNPIHSPLFVALNEGCSAVDELPTYGALQAFISDVTLPDDYTGLVDENHLDWEVLHG